MRNLCCRFPKINNLYIKFKIDSMIDSSNSIGNGNHNDYDSQEKCHIGRGIEAGSGKTSSMLNETKPNVSF